MTGTQSQIEWAEQIRPRVGADFDRVADAFEAVAQKQAGEEQNRTRAVIAMIGEMRAEVMANDSAGYFIRDWQELNDQVRRMIFRDPRYQAIKATKPAK